MIPSIPPTPPTPPGLVQRVDPSKLNQDFEAFKQDLLSKFPEGHIMHSIVHAFVNLIPNLDQKVTLKELSELAKERCNIQDFSRLPSNAFEKVSKHVIQIIRAACIHLYLEGRNPQGFLLGPTASLLTTESEVGWSLERSYMENLISQNTIST